MIKFIPGLIGAITAFIGLPFISWFNSWGLEFVAYIAAYLFVTVSLDTALIRYQGK